MKALRLNLPVAWLVTAIVSLAVGFGIALASKAADCTPQEIDGQCGMGTFFGLIYGASAGLVIFVGMSVFFLVVAIQRRRSKGQ
jgi:hypothetical protein